MPILQQIPSRLHILLYFRKHLYFCDIFFTIIPYFTKKGVVNINKTIFTKQLADELATILLKASRKEKFLTYALNLSMSIGCTCLGAAILAKKASPLFLIIIIPMVIACMKHIYAAMNLSPEKISQVLFSRIGNKTSSYWLTEDDGLFWCQIDDGIPKGTTFDKIRQVYETEHSFFILTNEKKPTFYAIDKSGFTDTESKLCFEHFLRREFI